MNSFITGCLIGMILMYSGVATFISGMVTGIVVQTNMPNLVLHLKTRLLESGRIFSDRMNQNVVKNVVTE